MLDAETKRKIDNCRDILVGKIPDPKSQVEQITIALIYKFMDDMDQDSVEQGGKPSFFRGEFQKYSWSSIFDRRLGGHEILNLYSEALNRMDHNPNIPLLFRDIFKHVTLPYRDPETLRLFLKEISGFTYDHSERLGDAFEYLLSVMDSQGKAGQFRTPRHIIDFIVKVVDPQLNETVLDPACGTAGFLISAYKHIRDNTPKLSVSQKKRLMTNFTGYDISYDMVRLTLVNMYLHGFPDPDPQIHEYDTLTYEDKWGETYDVIMANPPFMTPKGGIRPHIHFSIQAKRSEVLFVDYIAEHLNPSGRAGVIVPEGIIFKSENAYKKLRKMLVENHLWAIVSLPAGVFYPYSGVKTSILFMDKSLAKRIDKILFVKIENDGFDLGAQRIPIDQNDLPAALKFLNIYKSKASSHCKHREAISETSPICYTVPKSEIDKSSDCNLTGDIYRSLEQHKPSQWPIVELGKICLNILSGGTPSTKIPEYWNGNIPWITSADIIDFKNANPRKYITEKAIKESATNLIPKDNIIVVTRVGLGKLFLNNFDVCISQDSQGLIINKLKAIPEFLIYVLFVKVQQFKETSRGSTIQGVTKQQLSSLKIPLPPLEVQEKIVAEIDGYQKIIDAARQIVQSYKPTIKINPTWPMAEIGELCDLMTGGTPTSTVKKYYEKGNIRWLVSGDIHQEEIFDCANRITEEGMKNSNAKMLPVNSVLIALNGQGKTRGTVALLRVEATCNQSIVSMNPKNKNDLLSEYLYFILKGMYQQIRNITGDNQRSGLSMSIIKQIKIPLAPLDEQKQIVEQIETEQKIVDENKKLIEIFEKKIKDKIAEIWGE